MKLKNFLIPNFVKKYRDTLKEKGTVSKPKIGSRDAFFKLPSRLYDAPEATKLSYFKRQRISDPVNEWKEGRLLAHPVKIKVE